MTKTIYRSVARALGLILTVLVLSTSLHAEGLPSAKTGGVDGKPVNLLVVSSTANAVPLIDPVYRRTLVDAGYRVVALSHEALLSKEYLRQFGVVVLANLPYAGEEYTVFGYKLRNYELNIKLLTDYAAAGGGLVVIPAISEFGEAYGRTYDRFLDPWGGKLLIQQLKDGSSRKNQLGKGAYGQGSVVKNHTITRGIKGNSILYPQNVMRWDHSYSATPVLAGKGWNVLARADKANTHIAISNNEVGEPLTKNNILFAVRRAGKGSVAVSAIHSYYILTMVSSKENHIGENGTGVIDFKVMRGEEKGRASCFGKLLDRTYRMFAVNSAKHGIGGWKDVRQPEQPPYPSSNVVLDWKTQKVPATWAHRVIPSGGWPRTYDELADPSVQGEMKYWKMLIGPRTRYSSGAGTVKEYREAAIKAGYSAIVFTEAFEDLSPKMWKFLLKDCKDNTDESFVCLPGLDIEGHEGQRYLVLGADRYPSPDWLTADGKKLAAIRMLSLGWFGHVSVIHRPQHGSLNAKTYKHYTGIAVATYDTRGRQVDDGMFAYKWSVSTDSGPIPIAVHEVTRPEDVQHAVKGFQQILPAPALKGAVKYFRFAFSHSFDAPMRYFISEGPILDGWTLFNKDKGKAEENRTHFRMGVGVRSEDGKTPIRSIKLYDGFEVVRNWKHSTPEFKATVDGSHNAQHLYTLLAADAKGRRVLSPTLRTVTRNWRLRCGDKQNWLGSQLIYTGWSLNGLPGYNLKLIGSREGEIGWESPAVLDFPFFSDHVQVNDADMGYKYYYGSMKDVAGDAKGMLPMRANEVVDGHIRYTYFSDLKQKDFSVMVVDTKIALKQGIEVAARTLNPIIGDGGLMRANNLLIMPNKPPQQLGAIKDRKTGRIQPGDEKNRNIKLPIGAYAAGVVPLSDGLWLDGRRMGFAAEPGYKPAGTTWKTRFIMLRSAKFHWKTNRGRGGEVVDDKAEQALTEMGFRGRIPYALRLRQGRLEKTAYFAYLTATEGGVAGRNINKSGKPMLMYVPMLIRGLDTDSEMVLWRSDTKHLEAFAAFEGKGHISFNADKTVDFYAGNAAICDPALTVSIVIWDPDDAWFRVHNPTDKEITTHFATAAAIKGFKPLKTNITVAAGTSIEVKE